jgi:hypothetical protein
MPVHLQDMREDLYAQPACGASLYTGPTVSVTPDVLGSSIDCAQCRALMPTDGSE